MKINVSKYYPNKRVFQDLELEIPENKILCVMGASGVGKTTLLNILAGFLDYEGEITPKIEKTAYLFQTPRLLPHLSAKENLRYTAENSVTEEQISRTLVDLEIGDCANTKAKSLSGGERQRVAMARAFLSSAKLLLMDEPFSSLDLALKLRLISVFSKVWERSKKTTVLVTHDVDEALMLADSIVVLKNGGVAAVFDVMAKNKKYGEENKLRERILNALCKENN